MAGTDGRRTPGKGQSELIYKLRFPTWTDRPDSLRTTRFNLALGPSPSLKGRDQDDDTITAQQGGIGEDTDEKNRAGGEIRHELEEEILSLRKNAESLLGHPLHSPIPITSRVVRGDAVSPSTPVATGMIL